MTDAMTNEIHGGAGYQFIRCGTPRCDWVFGVSSGTGSLDPATRAAELGWAFSRKLGLWICGPCEAGSSRHVAQRRRNKESY